jgi:predicted PurR-regulated permease PerM
MLGFMMASDIGPPATRYEPPIRVLSGAVIGAVVVAALYVGRDVFVPVALAILLSFMLAPLVIWLQRHIPKTAAVAIAVSIAFLVIATFAYTVATQLTQLAGNLPSYQTNIQTKISAIRENAMSEGVIGRFGRFVERIGEELSRPADETAGETPASPDKPVKVEIAEPEVGPVAIVREVLGPLVKPLTTAGIVVVLVIFILLRRQDLRDRFIRLAGGGDLARTTEALEDAGSRVAQYLLMQLVVNVTYGIPIGLGLWLIGVPNALLWGMLATVLRFVPYIGPIIAMMLPIALAFAVDPGWEMLLWTVALFVVIELVSNNLIEPWLYGSRTGLSAFAIIVAAIFWTWLWGPIGLLLSTPLTVCLVVLGRHVRPFEFLDVLLGSEPVLKPAERLAQRLLAGDGDEATEIAEAYLGEHTLPQFYESIAVPALVANARDRDQGKVGPERRRQVFETTRILIDNLSDHRDPDEEPPSGQAAPAVVCLGGQTSLDDAAAAVLADYLARSGHPAISTTLAEISARPAPPGTLHCVAYLSEDPANRARYLARRLHRRDPAMPVGLVLLGASMPGEENMAQAIGAKFVARTLADCEAAMDAGDVRMQGGAKAAE